MSRDTRQRELIARLLGPSGPEVSCEECFDLLDEYVDLELAGEDADTRLPGMRDHLLGCPACHEDHESLRDLVSGPAPPRRAGSPGRPGAGRRPPRGRG